MKGFLKWFGEAAHAMGAIDAEEKSHVPPPSTTPYRDQPMKRAKVTRSKVTRFDHLQCPLRALIAGAIFPLISMRRGTANP